MRWILRFRTDFRVGGPSSRTLSKPSCRSAASALMSQPTCDVLSFVFSQNTSDVRGEVLEGSRTKTHRGHREIRPPPNNQGRMQACLKHASLPVIRRQDPLGRGPTSTTTEYRTTLQYRRTEYWTTPTQGILVPSSRYSTIRQPVTRQVWGLRLVVARRWHQRIRPRMSYRITAVHFVQLYSCSDVRGVLLNGGWCWKGHEQETQRAQGIALLRAITSGGRLQVACMHRSQSVIRTHIGDRDPVQL